MSFFYKKNKMNISDLKKDKLYEYNKLIDMVDEINISSKEDSVTILEYGPDFISEAVIHINQKENHYWFVLHMVSNSYYYKLIYIQKL